MLEITKIVPKRPINQTGVLLRSFARQGPGTSFQYYAIVHWHRSSNPFLYYGPTIFDMCTFACDTKLAKLGISNSVIENEATDNLYSIRY